MTTKKNLHRIALAAGLLAAALLVDGWLPGGFLAAPAQAVVGRPLTPMSYAGVARRTTRRTIYATSMYAATLPAGCRPVVVNGVTLQQCGATYYQPSGNQYVIVNVN